MSKVDDLLARLMPRRCVLCNGLSSATTVCAGCRGDLPWLARGCPICGAPMPAGLEDSHCARCAAGDGSTPAARVFSALSYEYPVDRLIAGAKFHRALPYARALGELLAAALAAASPPLTQPELLVPVPLHRRRLRERGYNQSTEIARPVAEALRLALAPAVCERVRATPEQTGLSAVERRRNLRNAFKVHSAFAGAPVAILDDAWPKHSSTLALRASRCGRWRAHCEEWVNKAPGRCSPERFRQTPPRRPGGY